MEQSLVSNALVEAETARVSLQVESDDVTEDGASRCVLLHRCASLLCLSRCALVAVIRGTQQGSSKEDVEFTEECVNYVA